MRIIYMGTADFAVPALRRLKRRHDIAAVITAPDRPAGRGRRMQAPPLKTAAVEMGLPLWQPDNLKDEAANARLRALQPEAVVLAAYGRLLPPAFLAVPERGCLNLHPSLLPRYRGAVPVAAQILGGDAFGGISVMEMDAGLDTGPVFAQAQLPIMDDDITPSLTAKLAVVGAHLMDEVLAGLERGEIAPRPQDEAAASYAGPLTREDGEIDWRRPAAALWRQVRAYQPWPGSHTRWRGERLELLRVRPEDAPPDLEPGRVVALPGARPAGFGVGTGDGLLRVLRVKPAGKKEMDAAAFLAGHAGIIGARLPAD